MKELTQSLVRVLQFLEAIVTNTPAIAIYIYDREGRIQLWNPICENLYGFKAKKVLGERLQDILLRPEEVPLFEAEVAKMWETQEPIKPCERIVRQKDGALRYVYSSRFPLVHRKECVAICCMDVDITQRKRAEELLQESEKKYRALFEELKDVVFMSTPDGKLLDINPAGVELFGYSSREELLKVDVYQDLYFNRQDRKLLEQKLAQQGFVKDFELIMKRKDGQKLIVLETATAVRDEAGAIVAYRGMLRDVTEQKQLEEQLRQSQKIEAIGRLAGGVAHDFNNLLTVIMGFSDRLLKGLGQDDPLHRNAVEIRKAAERAASLTHQLLAFSRRQILTPRILNLNTIIINLEGMLQRLIGEHIELITVLGPNLGRVKADPGQIEQVILNLVVNARDAMPQGGKLIIETANFDADEMYIRRHPTIQLGTYVMLSVSDTGVGMDEETRSHLFEPFFTTKEVGKGTGLGLSTVYGIIKQSGGNIRVYSELGQGTTFKVFLPCVTEDIKTTELNKASDLSLHGSETILLVEDQEKVRTLIRESLQRNGYTVLEAGHGMEALQVSEQHEGSIDLLVTDIVMPQMGGRELVQHLTPLRPEMKVLYISGYTDNAFAQNNSVGSDVAFLQKPFTPDVLIRKVREVLDAS